MTTAHTETPKLPRTSLAAIRRRLEKLELEHLRSHAAELAEKVERLTADLENAEWWATSWQDDCLQLMQDQVSDGGAIGLSKDGSLHLIPAEAGAA